MYKKMANDLVVKNNALIDASYTLSLVEQRLIGLALVKANNQHQEITSDTVLTIHAGEYAEQFKVDGSVCALLLLFEVLGVVLLHMVVITADFGVYALSTQLSDRSPLMNGGL